MPQLRFDHSHTVDHRTALCSWSCRSAAAAGEQGRACSAQQYRSGLQARGNIEHLYKSYVWLTAFNSVRQSLNKRHNNISICTQSQLQNKF